MDKVSVHLRVQLGCLYVWLAVDVSSQEKACWKAFMSSVERGETFMVEGLFDQLAHEPEVSSDHRASMYDMKLTRVSNGSSVKIVGDGFLERLAVTEFAKGGSRTLHYLSKVHHSAFCFECH